MRQILDELFFGNIRPSSKQMARGSDYDRAVQRIAQAEEELSARLAGEELKLFHTFGDGFSEVDGTGNLEYFKMGFRLGAQIMLEALEGGSCCLRDL